MSQGHSRFTEESFELLAALARNNDKGWYTKHRHDFDACVRQPFADFLLELTERLSGTDIALKGDGSTMFRQARDVRFSNDKRPYSESVSGLLTLTGTKHGPGRLAYVELDADGGRIGGGMHQPSAKDLEPVRRRIVDEPDEFHRVLETLMAADVDIERTNAVETMPRGFADHANHRFADIVRLKQLLAMRPIPVSAWIDASAVESAAEAVIALAALYSFIEKARG